MIPTMPDPDWRAHAFGALARWHSAKRRIERANVALFLVERELAELGIGSPTNTDPSDHTGYSCAASVACRNMVMVWDHHYGKPEPRAEVCPSCKANPPTTPEAP